MRLRWKKTKVVALALVAGFVLTAGVPPLDMPGRWSSDPFPAYSLHNLTYEDGQQRALADMADGKLLVFRFGLISPIYEKETESKYETMSVTPYYAGCILYDFGFGYNSVVEEKLGISPWFILAKS